MIRGRVNTLARAAFVVYALVLVTLTHWPNLKVDAGIPRTDLWAHATAYGLWTLLLLAAGWLGPRLSWKNLALGTPVALAWAGLDELSQGIPGLGRFVTWADYGANAVGVLIGSGGWIVIVAMNTPRAGEQTHHR